VTPHVKRGAWVTKPTSARYHEGGRRRRSEGVLQLRRQRKKSGIGEWRGAETRRGNEAWERDGESSSGIDDVASTRQWVARTLRVRKGPLGRLMVLSGGLKMDRVGADGCRARDRHRCRSTRAVPPGRTRTVVGDKWLPSRQQAGWRPIPRRRVHTLTKKSDCGKGGGERTARSGVVSGPRKRKKERKDHRHTHPDPPVGGAKPHPETQHNPPPPVRRWGRQRTRRRDRGGDGRRRCGRHRRNGVSGTQPTRRAAQGGAGRGRAHRPASAPATPRNSGWVKMGMPTFENNGKKKRQGDPIGRRKRQLTSLSGGVEGSI